MKKIYSTPELELVKLTSKDIMVLSTEDSSLDDCFDEE